MHYNLHERLKPKRNIPYKKIFIFVGAALLVVVIHFVLVHYTTDTPKPPAAVQRGPA